MSAYLVGLVFETWLPPQERLVMMYLADDAATLDDDVSLVLTITKRLASKTGLSEAEVETVVKALVGRGLLIGAKPTDQDPVGEVVTDLLAAAPGGANAHVWRIEARRLKALAPDAAIPV